MLIKQNSLKGTDGSTLTEVIVGLGTLMVVLAGVFQLIFTGLSIQEKARVTNHIAQVIQEEVETLRNSRWVNVGEYNASTTIDLLSNAPELAIFNPKMTRVAIDDTADQKKIYYLYSWTDRGNTTHTGRFSTYYSKGGMSDSSYRHF